MSRENRKKTLSVVLAAKNEEENIGSCLQSVTGLASEMIVFDEFSTDNTRIIARKYGAKVFKYKHKTNFHETKQKSIDKAKGDWILQLDADEVVTSELAREIKEAINFNNEELVTRKLETEKRNKLFVRHQRLIEAREGELGKPTGEVVAFFIPRLNFFLGKPIRYAGTYPDGVIRLFKKGKARLPGKSVHELMEVDGEVGWLFSNLEHHDSPTFSRYFARMSRYTDLQAEDLKSKRIPKNPIYFLLYAIYYPMATFCKLYVRHLGLLDGGRGFLWSLFSALHFPVSYLKYLTLKASSV